MTSKGKSRRPFFFLSLFCPKRKFEKTWHGCWRMKKNHCWIFVLHYGKVKLVVEINRQIQGQSSSYWLVCFSPSVCRRMTVLFSDKRTMTRFRSVQTSWLPFNWYEWDLNKFNIDLDKYQFVFLFIDIKDLQTYEAFFDVIVFSFRMSTNDRLFD